jgi:hypothetical protein
MVAGESFGDQYRPRRLAASRPRSRIEPARRYVGGGFASRGAAVSCQSFPLIPGTQDASPKHYLIWRLRDWATRR